MSKCAKFRCSIPIRRGRSGGSFSTSTILSRRATRLVRPPYTDLFFLFLHHATSIKLTIFLDIGVGKHRQLVDVSELNEILGQEYFSILPG